MVTGGRTLVDPLRSDRLGRLPDAGQVDADHLLPLVVGELPERGLGPDAGVGDEDVDLPELRDAAGNRLVELPLVAYVGLDGRRSPVVRLDLLDGLVEVVLGGHGVGHSLRLAADVDGDDVRA